MARRPLTVEELWSLPRVGAPAPAPDGTHIAVPVTRWSLDTDESTTRLWLVDTGRRRAEPRPLTSSDHSCSDPAWSPDGRRLVYVRRPGGDKESDRGAEHPDQGQLYLLDLEGGEPRRLTDLPLGARDPRWFPDGQRIAFLVPLDREGLTPAETARLLREREENPPLQVEATEDRLYRFWDRWLTRGEVHHLFVLDVGTGEMMDLLPGSRRWFNLMDPGDQYRISPEGSEICFCACRSEPPHSPVLWGTFTVKVPERIPSRGKAPKVRQLPSPHEADTLPGSYSPDGNWIVYGFQKDPEFYADRVQLLALHRSTGRQVRLAPGWELSPSHWDFLPGRHDLILQAEEDARVNLYRLDVAAARRSPEKVEPELVARGGHFGPPRPAGERIFCNHDSLTEPPEAWSLDRSGRSRRRLTAFTDEAVSRLDLGQVVDRRFRGADGRWVQMWLVAPPGASLPGKGSSGKGPLPLVHVIHGGPHGISADAWHFRWNPQIFAGAGYLAAMVNFHGSTSWGQEFAACIQGAWGDKPYRDIEAATDDLVESGLADPKRMAVTGASYGGYLVSWIVSQTDRYRCAVNHAGVCDFQTQLGSDVTEGDERAMGGNLWDRQEEMDRWNPVRHADGFATPLLILHGEKDYRVPYYQGLQLYNIYKMRDLPARLVVYPEENHWILTPRAARHWYGEVLGWLDRWMKKGRR